VIGLAREIEWMTVREVPAVRQIHPQDRVARLDHGRVGGLIGLRSGMRLNVGVLGAEELPGSIARQILDHIGELAAAVVALTRITFGVFVGEDAAGGFEHRFGSEILAGDEFEPPVLALRFMLDGVVDVRVHLGERARHSLLIGHWFQFSADVEQRRPSFRFALVRPIA
jgi:hypothetical protein